MKRLTKRTEKGHIYMDCSACPIEGRCVNYSEADKTCMQVLLKRLSEYEDTGYTPTQVRKQIAKVETVVVAELSDDTIKKIAAEAVKAQQTWFRAIIGGDHGTD